MSVLPLRFRVAVSYVRNSVVKALFVAFALVVVVLAFFIVFPFLPFCIVVVLTD